MTKISRRLVYDLLIQGCAQEFEVDWILGYKERHCGEAWKHSALLRNLDFMLEEMRKCYQLKGICDCLT